MRMHQEQQRLRQRLQGDYVSYNSNRPDIGFLDTPVPEMPPNADRPFFYRGFPRLSYTVATYRYTEDGACSLVAECMKAAGRVASRFSLDNNVPVIHVGLPKTVYVSENTENTCSQNGMNSDSSNR